MKNSKGTKSAEPIKDSRPSAPVPTPAPTIDSSSQNPSGFFSKSRRQAKLMCKHVVKLINHQRDILPAQALTAVSASLEELQAAVARKAPDAAIEKGMENLGKAADKWIKPYPNSAWRENTEVLLVALAVAMGIRTFFVQPFKIPTGSMQPTLYGVTSINLKAAPEFPIPTGLDRIKEWFQGVSYVHVVADEDGNLDAVYPPFRILIFNIWQKFVIGGRTQTIWFPPDYGEQNLEDRSFRPGRAGISVGDSFHKGDDVVKIRMIAGDHLFVDRVTYNFRKPSRGEIIVFETKGIPPEYRDVFGIPGNQFYIKRLVGLGAERIQLGQDRHLIINGTNRLDSSTPHFEKVYSFARNQPPRESQYSGHVDTPGLARFFRDRPNGVEIPPDHYMVMGDNTMNSLDSRSWGYFPANSVIGRSFFVYWPLSDRFGLGYNK